MASPLPNRTDVLAAELRDAILRGQFRPGDRLPAERELAARHAVHRTSVREALKKLEQLGLVDIRRGGGAHVCPVNQASVEVICHLLQVDGELDASLAAQVLDVTEIMLSGAARLAIERANDSELAEAKASLRELAADDLTVDERLARLDALFELITRASGNLLLRMIYNAIRPALVGDLGRSLCGTMLATRGDFRERFEAVEAAIDARDPQATEEAIRRLQREDRERLLLRLRNLPEGEAEASA